MRVHSIPLTELPDGLPPSAARARSWCEQLESGDILYFPQTPLPIPAADLEFLLSRQAAGSRFHKNISYKPANDALSGLDRAPVEDLDRLHDIMSRYSASVTRFLAGFLAPYNRRWQLDYASFRPVEEQGRKLPLRSRNDLLHTDAFPTRPTRGARILRFFHNIHPTRTRDWIIGDPFPRLIGRFVRSAKKSPAIKGPGLSAYFNRNQQQGAIVPEENAAPRSLQLPRPELPFAHALKFAACRAGLAAAFPALRRSPYDQFMMRLHNTMKEDAQFQRTCPREEVRFAPGSSWMVYTETVPHAVLAGQYALEQTFLVDPEAQVTPGSAPVAVLENLAGARLR